MSAELKAARRDATLILTLSNPGANNMLHADMVAAAIETLSTAERDDSVRAVVLTGANHFFCAGSDLHHLLESRNGDIAQQANSIDNLHSWIDAIRACPKPVIAAVEGTAAGAGFSLALACDLIVAGTSAQFASTYANAGLTPRGGTAWLLMQALPRQLASEILMEGKSIDARRLQQLGIVNRVVTDGTVLDAALTWADELAGQSPNAIEHIKSMLREAPDHSLVQHFAGEKQSFLQSLHHRDAHEGISAFLDNRKPRYK